MKTCQATPLGQARRTTSGTTPQRTSSSNARRDAFSSRSKRATEC